MYIYKIITNKKKEVNVMKDYVKVNASFLEKSLLSFKDGNVLYCYSFVNEFLGVFKVYSKTNYDLIYDNDYNVSFVVEKDFNKYTLKLKLGGIDEI